MLHTILESGLLNVTAWCLLSLWLLFLIGWLPRTGRLRDKVIVLAITFCTLGTVAYALYKAYAVPRDVLQDIIAADEYLAGRPMHSENMGPLMIAALEREARPSLLGFSPDLQVREREQRAEALEAHWVQAHPPFMTLFTAPFVHFLGILGTQIAFFVLSLASLISMLWLLQREHPRAPSWALPLGVFMLIVGWDPVLVLFRSGQIGMVMCALLTMSWYLLRHDRPISAGVAAGLAISLKLFPAVILVVLLMRHRRAFISAAASIGAIFVCTLAATSWQDHLDYLRISSGVVKEYAAYPTNISLLGYLARGARFFGLDLATAKAAWLGIGVLIALGMMWLLRRQPRTLTAQRYGLDLEFSLAMTLMPLLSPVAWDHYLVFLLFPLSMLVRHAVRNPAPERWFTVLTLLLLLAIPDPTYTWINGMLRSRGQAFFGTWLLLPLRTAILGFIALWIVRLIRYGEVFIAIPNRARSARLQVAYTSKLAPVHLAIRSADIGASSS